MADTMVNLEHVYAKWEGRNPYRSCQPSNSRVNFSPSQEGESRGARAGGGREAWRAKFGDNLPAPPFRRSKYRRREAAEVALPLVGSLINIQDSVTLISLQGSLGKFFFRG